MKLKSNRLPSVAPRFAVSVDRVPETSATAIPANNGSPPAKVNGEEGSGGALVEREKHREKKEKPNRRSGWKDYVEQSKEMIEPDGGPPRWFSPLESGSRLDNSPLLLFLPGQSFVLIYFLFCFI